MYVYVCVHYVCLISVPVLRNYPQFPDFTPRFGGWAFVPGVPLRTAPPLDW